MTLDRNAFVHTAELNGSRHFSNNWVSVGIPVGNNVTRGNLRLIAYFNSRTVGYFVAFTFPTHMIKNRQFTRTRYRDQGAIGAVHHFNVVEFDHTIRVDLNIVLSRLTRCCTTNVEGAHGELSTRFTNGLRGNNTNRFTQVNLMTAA